MTYVDRLNVFNRWLATNYLPGNSTLLFYRLLALFNEAGWPESIQVDNYRLMSMVDTRTERVAISARDKLVDVGFIQYSKGKKKCPNTYYLTSYTPQKVSVSGSVFDSESDSVSGSDSVPKTVSHIKSQIRSDIPSCPPQGETRFGDDLQSAFEAWLSYKAEKRQSYKPTGLKSLVAEIRNNAQHYGEAAVAKLIRECMASNWRGIIFDRLKQGGGQAFSEQPMRKFDPVTGDWR